MTKRGHRWIGALPIAAIAVAVGWGGWMLVDDDNDPRPPVDIASAAASMASLADLVASASMVVEGEVVDVEDGRTITASSDPTTGIRSQLVHIDVARSWLASRDVVVVEQEASLLDGTPITVDGQEPLQVGDRGVFLLVDGHSDEFPYSALVDARAVFLLGAADRIAAGGTVFDGRDISDLRAALDALAS
jgi:hypothetical protein